MPTHCTAGCPLKGNDDSMNCRINYLWFSCIVFFWLFFFLSVRKASTFSRFSSLRFARTLPPDLYTSPPLNTIVPLLYYRSIESTCPSCLDLIILLSGCSLTHIIILQREAYGITVPSITAYSTVHIPWMTGCHYILMHLIENIESL